MTRITAILFVAVLPLSLHAQHRDNCSPTRASIFLNQYQREVVVKQHLLQCAIEAPTENLWREMKNKDAFVRWAASVEINRRWNLEKDLEKSKNKSTDKGLSVDQKSPLLKGISK